MIKKVNYKIIKKGRKWFKGENEKGYVNNIEINEVSKNFEIGEKYNFWARIEKEVTKFGTKIKIFPVSEKEIKESENNKKIEKIIEQIEKNLRYIEDNYGWWYSKGENKILELIKELEKLEQEERVEEYKNKLLELKRNYYNNIITLKIEEAYQNISELNFNDYKYNKLKELIKKSENIISKEMYRKYKTILENILEKKKEQDEKIYISRKKEKQQKLLEKLIEDIDNNLYFSSQELSEEKFHPDLHNNLLKVKKKYNEKFGFLDKDKKLTNNMDIFLRNVFEKINYKNFILNNIQTAFNNHIIDDIDEYKEEYLKYHENILETISYKDDIYILDISLNKDDFKYLIKKGYINNFLNYVREYIKNNKIQDIDELEILEIYRDRSIYYSKYPETVIKYLYVKEYIKPIENEDLEKLKLWTNIPSHNNWEYRKEYAFGQEYFLIKEEKNNPLRQERNKYYAYYIVGYDSDTKRGFQHRIPWKPEGYYESKSIKEIIDEIFYYNKGYKRIQGDLVVKEINYEEITTKKKITEIKKYLKILNCDNNYINTCIMSKKTIEETKTYKDNKLLSSDIEKFEKDFGLNNNIELRKDFVLKIINGVAYKESGIIYVKGNFKFIKKCKEMEFNLKNEEVMLITKEKIEGFDKLAYGYYHKIFKSTESIKENSKELERMDIYVDGKKQYCDDVSLIKLNDKYIKRYKNRLFNIGNHQIVGNIIAANNIYTNNIIRIIKGKFKLYHSSHSFVEYGEENKYYALRPAIRHITKMDLKD